MRRHTRRLIGGRSRSAVIALLLALAATAGGAADARYTAVQALGELNGVALQCRYIDQVRRMKAAVVAYAPKERSFGLAFDEATNDAFLAFARRGDACPAADGFTRQVGHRIDALRDAFE